VRHNICIELSWLLARALRCATPAPIPVEDSLTPRSSLCCTEFQPQLTPATIDGYQSCCYPHSAVCSPFQPFLGHKTIDVAVESNAMGTMCHVVQLPGAFTRGPARSEALLKVRAECSRFLFWLGWATSVPATTTVVQHHRSMLDIQDADSDILLDADCVPVDDVHIEQLCLIATHSAESVQRLYGGAEDTDWVDTHRSRPTFYGQRPDSIRKILEHLERTEVYYLSRFGLAIQARDSPYLHRREESLCLLRGMAKAGSTPDVTNIDDELWTLPKALRRLIWHDRIHAKSLVRILEAQRVAGRINSYEDPFHFFG
jgi:hypothetical protein